MKHFLLILLFLPTFLFAQDNLVHSSTSYVDDFANVISPQDAQDMDQMIRDFKQKSEVEFSIVTVPDIGDISIEDYTIKLARRWGVGTKANQGVMILLSMNPHGLRTEVGTGLEGDLTDYFTKQSQDDLAIPLIKNGDYGGGLKALLGAYLQQLDPTAITQRKVADAKKTEISKAKMQNFVIDLEYTAFILACIGLTIFFIVRRKRKDKKEKILLNAAYLDYRAACKKFIDKIAILREVYKIIPNSESTFNAMMNDYSSIIRDINGGPVAKVTAGNYISVTTQLEESLKQYEGLPVFETAVVYTKTLQDANTFLLQNMNFISKNNSQRASLQALVNDNMAKYADFWIGINLDYFKQNTDKIQSYLTKIKDFTTIGLGANENNFNAALGDIITYLRWTKNAIDQNNNGYQLINSQLQASIDKVKKIESYKETFTNYDHQAAAILITEHYLSASVISQVTAMGDVIRKYEAASKGTDQYSRKWTYYSGALTILQNTLKAVQAEKDAHYAEIKRKADEESRRRRDEEESIRRAAAVYSSSSSYDSSSSSSFSGGDFSGGGSSSSW